MISEIAQSAGKRFRVRYGIFERVWHYEFD